MFTTSSDLSRNKTLEIKQDDKFFSRLLSKENSVADPSFRVYYGGVSGSIPFMWESQPGIPKQAFSDTSLVPPLTPPPSYYSKSNSKPFKKHSRSGLLHALFPKMTSLNLKANIVPSSPSSSSSTSWSSSSWKIGGGVDCRPQIHRLIPEQMMKEPQPLDHQLRLNVSPLEGGVSVSVVDAIAGDSKTSNVSS